MGHSTCCVVKCRNTGTNSHCKFYRFPTARHKLEQRKKWIAAVKRRNFDGSPWFPKPSDLICSEHFIGNKKSEEELSPSYIPTIFPDVNKTRVVDQSAAISRHNRFMKRRSARQKPIIQKSPLVVEDPIKQEILDDPMNNDIQIDHNENKNLCTDQECQVDFFSNSRQPSKTFICNRYIYSNFYSDAETQTEILGSATFIKIPNQKKFKDKQCGTPQKYFLDQSVGCDFKNDELAAVRLFAGIESVNNDEQLLDLAGVTFDNFKFLLNITAVNASDASKISKANRLFIFLVKMKTGLTFSAISVLFAVHRTTISRIFFSILQHLACATANLVFWPDKDIVQGTMPECFHPKYSSTRVIIDCTEFRIQIPKSVDNRVYTYSHYKRGFTAKVLIGITPAGFISFKSKVAGGRKSDSQMIIESGLIDLLEDGDIVLADKGFPDIIRNIDRSGKKVMLVMPPFLENKSESTKEQTEETYNIAKVRIHVERIMQRLRTYQILDKIPEHLFNCIDDIVHISCVLVNLQPPIISHKKEIDK